MQAQILNLMGELQKRLGLTYLFISHNLAVVRHLAHRVAVMYLGRIVETGPVHEVLLQPRHPYTQALISVLPGGGGDHPGTVLTGEPPDPTAIPPGCRFHPRCPRLADLPAEDARAELCRGKPVPVLPAIGKEATGATLIACHLAASHQAPAAGPVPPYSHGAR